MSKVILKTVPVRRGHKLRITWPMTPGIHHYMEGPMVIELTDAGHANAEHIIGLLFKYITLLQQSGVCKWIFDELYPSKDWLVGSFLLSTFSPEVIQSALNELTPNNVRIFWESTNFDGHTEMTEPWYGTAFSVEKTTGSTIQEWMKRAPEEDLHLPCPNVFIPTDLSIKNVKEKVNIPFLLRKSQ
ncbi:unnamed protein product [Lactuca virosa]|uniref:Peptidase M16 middle/third domain-containing protein n=1 Tax=Lactuca virosa TaxID=75947 RepID=A0AAU9P3W4_9ASTR|nr:unnamed protein product [Lactuca virosa]